MPGYCVSGTVGAKVLSGQKKVEIENRQVIDVKLSVQVGSESKFALCFILILMCHSSTCLSARMPTPRASCS